MEYVRGGDLRSAVLAGKISPEQVLPLILAVGESLAFAHQCGVIHRDVKPANILLEELRPKLTDFDLARASNTTGGTRTNGGWGSFVYTAPEVLDNAAGVSTVSDVYSLSMTAIFCFLGSDIPSDVLRDPDSVVDRLACSPHVKEVLRRGIDWYPGKRPESMRDLCQGLQGFKLASVGSRSNSSVLLRSAENFVFDSALGLVCDQLVRFLEGKEVPHGEACKLLTNRILVSYPGLSGSLRLEPAASREELARILARLLQGDSETRELVANLLRPASEGVKVSTRAHDSGKALKEDSRKARRSRKTLQILVFGSVTTGIEWLSPAKPHRKRINLVEGIEFRWLDLPWFLLEYQPEILQLTALPSEGRIANGENCARLFSIWKGPLRCIICDSFLSLVEADLLAREVGLVIHLGSLRGSPAFLFLKFFYRGLASGRTIQESFEIAHWQLDGPAGLWGGADLPVLLGDRLDFAHQVPAED
jgi:serine/threonine protein kinase